MRTRVIRLRFRRRWRKGQRQVEDLGLQAEQQLDRHLFRRFERLRPVRRFLFGWLSLISLLIIAVAAQNISLSGYYQTLRPAAGGIYSEGLVGHFTNANPLYAVGDADASVSRLIFAGLFTYDSQDRLIGDLASRYSVDSRGTTYTVRLKPGLKWQDGRPLTSADVAFTYDLIQNPDTQSPLQSSWQGIKVSAPDARTVVFKLPGELASFPDNLTNGIVPKHLLGGVSPSDLRTADFNTVRPVGAGPFAWQAINVKSGGDPDASEQEIALTPFGGYQGGAPRLQKFVLRIFGNDSQLAKAFVANQVTAAEGLRTVPAAVQRQRSVIKYDLPLRAANMVFFKTSTGLLADRQLRQALVRGADVPAIIAGLNYPTRAVREPLLSGQLGYDPALTQAAYNQIAAKQLLDAAGWPAGRGGQRSKAGQPLAFTLSAADTPENRYVAGQLQRQWQALGVQLHVQLQGTADFQSTLAYHAYDAVLYGISIGVDPDVFVYWDSSQADIRSANRLNLAEWKNPAADAALEAGRTRLNPALRTIKYKPFLQAWQQDAPALGLYQPRLLYLSHGPVSGLDSDGLNTPANRFDNVQNWEIRQAKVTN